MKKQRWSKNCCYKQLIFRVLFLVLLGNSTPLSIKCVLGQELPPVGSHVLLSQEVVPPLLKGIKVFEDNPLRMDFILDKGASLDSVDVLQSQAHRMVRYFLAALTIPENDLWVNLSPDERDRIIPQSFGWTEMGRDLLAQDYLLKQISASLIDPQEKTGQEFWDKVYREAQKRYGTKNIPINTFNKVWIVPQKAVVFESGDSAYITESHLKVMLQEDYLALEKRTDNLASAEINKGTNRLSTDVLREVVVPVLEKEVNEGKNFSQLRQIYHSLILAIWLKRKMSDSYFSQTYFDQEKIAGIALEDKEVKDKIWAQYLESFRKGAVNFVREEFDSKSGQLIPRKYFSGGAGFQNIRSVWSSVSSPSVLPISPAGELKLRVDFSAVGPDNLNATVSSAAVGLDLETTRQILSEGQMDVSGIKDIRLKNFLEKLNALGLSDIVVIGGAAKDHLLGDSTSILNITLKVNLADEERLEYVLSPVLKDERLWDIAKKRLEILAHSIGVTVEQMLLAQDNPNVATFEGIPVTYIGPTRIGDTVVKQYVVDETTQRIMSMVSGPSILNLAIDGNGRFYGHQVSLADLQQGRVRIYGQPEQLTLAQVIRVLASAAEFRLSIDEQTQAILKKRAAELLFIPVSPDQRKMLQRIYHKYLEVIKSRMGQDAVDGFKKMTDDLGILAVLEHHEASNIAHSILETSILPIDSISDPNAEQALRNLIDRLARDKLSDDGVVALQTSFDQMKIQDLSTQEISGLLDYIEEHISYLRDMLNRNLEGVILPRTVAAHEFTTVSSLSETDMVATAVDYQRIGIMQHISHQLLLVVAQRNISPKFLPVGLNHELVLKTLRTGRIEESDMPEPVRNFFKFLRDKNLDNVILVGGAVRDIFFGRAPDDFDVGIVADGLSAQERGIASFTRTEANERIWQVAQDSLQRLSKDLGSQPIYLLRSGDPNASRFEGREVQWAGPLKIFAVGVTLRQMLAERSSDGAIGEFYPSSSGPSNLRVGIDANGRVYGLRGILDYALGRVEIDGDGNNFSMGAVLRSVRLYIGFGLEWDPSVKTFIRRSVNQYLQGITPVGDNDFNIATGLLEKIFRDIGSDVVKRQRLDSLIHELEIDKVIALLNMHHDQNSQVIDIKNISQDNLAVFYNRLNVRADITQWGLRFDSYAENYFSREFIEDIRSRTAEDVEIHIGDSLPDEDKWQSEGWAVQRLFINRGFDSQRADVWNQRLYRFKKEGRVRYVFEGVITPAQIYQLLAALKVFNYPVNQIMISNNQQFDLRKYYQKQIGESFTDVRSIILTLNIFIKPLLKELKRAGWVVIQDKTALGLSYLRLEKDGHAIVCAYLNSMQGQASATFFDIAHSLGVKDFVFWGTVGALNPNLKYMDSLYPRKVFHADDPNIYQPPVNLRANESAVFSGDIVDVHTPFNESIPVLRNYREMGVAAVEMELFWLFKWVNELKDPKARLDVVLNVSEVLTAGMTSLPQQPVLSVGQKQNIFNLHVREEIRRIVKSVSSSALKGGIDLTRSRKSLYVKTADEGMKFRFDPASIEQLRGAQGLTPIIVDFWPMEETVPQFLGVMKNVNTLRDY